MTLRGGALITGSLMWDSRKGRPEWRKDNLQEDNGFRVYLPIRYGRLSESRHDTYTMTFSDICHSRSYNLGTGWVLPLKSEIEMIGELEEVARGLAKAEGIRRGLSTHWGSVALLLNPGLEVQETLQTGWVDLMSEALAADPLKAEWLKSEKPPINVDGFLTIRWPQEVSLRNRLARLHFLIAVVTAPVLKKKGRDGREYSNHRYASVYDIVEAMVKAEYYKYFLMNRKHRIETFQDRRILRRIPPEEQRI